MTREALGDARRPAQPAQNQAITDAVTSKDGTIIGYRRLGHGPGLVLLHGAMESGQSHWHLAEALADAFTIYLPDRRGRGLSGPYRQDDRLATEVEDLAAVLDRTGARAVFGVSSGAVICLGAALVLPSIEKAAIFEPPLAIDGSLSTSFLPRFDREIAEGRIAAALVTAMKGAQMGPALFQLLPNRLLEFLTKITMAAEDRKAGPDALTMRKLAPTLHYDFQMIAETASLIDSFRTIGTKMLMLGGSKSPRYLKASLDALERILPNARRIELPGLDHGGSGNTDRGGRPDQIASELRSFFG